MTSTLALVAIGAAQLGLMVAIYAVPMQRTYRKEHDLPLKTPGPEVQSPLEVR